MKNGWETNKSENARTCTMSRLAAHNITIWLALPLVVNLLLTFFYTFFFVRILLVVWLLLLVFRHSPINGPRTQRRQSTYSLTRTHSLERSNVQRARTHGIYRIVLISNSTFHYDCFNVCLLFVVAFFSSFTRSSSTLIRIWARECRTTWMGVSWMRVAGTYHMVRMLSTTIRLIWMLIVLRRNAHTYTQRPLHLFRVTVHIWSDSEVEKSPQWWQPKLTPECIVVF